MQSYLLLEIKTKVTVTLSNDVGKNAIGKQVKIHDLEDNMDISRLPQVTEKDLARLNKYIEAYKYLKG